MTRFQANTYKNTKLNRFLIAPTPTLLASTEVTNAHWPSQQLDRVSPIKTKTHMMHSHLFTVFRYKNLLPNERQPDPWSPGCNPQASLRRFWSARTRRPERRSRLRWARTCSWCYKTLFGGNLYFPKIKKFDKACSVVNVIKLFWRKSRKSRFPCKSIKRLNFLGCGGSSKATDSSSNPCPILHFHNLVMHRLWAWQEKNIEKWKCMEPNGSVRKA